MLSKHPLQKSRWHNDTTLLVDIRKLSTNSISMGDSQGSTEFHKKLVWFSFIFF